MKRAKWTATLLGVAAIAYASTASADDVVNSHPWDFKVHNTPVALAKAVTVRDADHNRTGYGLGLSQASGSGFPSGVVSVGNMNIVTVTVGDGSSADVAVEADQTNHGNIDATAVAASGTTVDIGDIKSLTPTR